jgi:hypothetical protein
MKRVGILVALIALVLLFRVTVERIAPNQPMVEPVVAEPLDEISMAAAEVRALHTLVVNFLTAVKEPYRPPLGDNEDLVRALTGGNRHGDVFLATNDPSLNAYGQLVDRWGTPYHIHPRAADAIDIRSAGPDRTLFTPDDVMFPAGR